jgi:hypothetical protein
MEPITKVACFQAVAEKNTGAGYDTNLRDTTQESNRQERQSISVNFCSS